MGKGRNYIRVERQAELEPGRMEYAQRQVNLAGYAIDEVDAHSFTFTFKGQPVKFFPYTGWATGKTIRDGRGIHNLLKQIKCLKK